jgi:hypothetical protein
MRFQRPLFFANSCYKTACHPRSGTPGDFTSVGTSYRSRRLGHTRSKLAASLIGLVAAGAVYAGDPLSKNQEVSTAPPGVTESAVHPSEARPLEPHIVPDRPSIEIAPGSPAEVEQSAVESESESSDIYQASPTR